MTEPIAFAELTRAPLDLAALEAKVARPEAGAVVSFLGVTRNHHEQKPVLRLEYSAQEALARKALEALVREAIAKFGLTGAALVHRLGTLEIGEASVAIATSAAHRGAAFDGCRYLIDTLKTTIPIWKKEYFAGEAGAIWVGPDGKPVA
jgi:molybdopterin synthase catalytic subunit